MAPQLVGDLFRATPSCWAIRKGLRPQLFSKTHFRPEISRFRKFASPDSARNNTMRANLARNFLERSGVALVLPELGKRLWWRPGFFRALSEFSRIFCRECPSGVERGFFPKLVQTAGLWYGGGGGHYTLLRPSAVVPVRRFADPRSFSGKSVLEARTGSLAGPRRSLWHSLSSARTRSGRTGIAFHLPHRDGKNNSDNDVHNIVVLC